MTSHELYGWLSPWFRERRLRRLHALLGRLDTVLDVGGYPWCWNDPLVPRERITLLNLEIRPDIRAAAQGFQLQQGDGCALPYADRAFDLLFSNSVIEHVGSWERQQEFAREARRVGQRLWVQTPAREFFLEPHFLTPFIHWLPLGVQQRLMRNFTLRGWIDRPDPDAARAFAAELRLLTFAEMRSLFPDCTILRERFLGFTKSYIAVRSSP
jgi:hypothetical protein